LRPRLGESIREVVFLATSRCRAIKGFRHFISLVRIVIPRSVELIDSSGFSRCSSLTEVIFESGSHLTRINGFRRCTALSRIVIPSSVETIDFDAFCDCTSLVEVILESGSRLKLLNGFQECASLRQIALPPSLGLLLRFLRVLELCGWSGRLPDSLDIAGEMKAIDCDEFHSYQPIREVVLIGSFGECADLGV
jgi:hypothetical protein